MPWSLQCVNSTRDHFRSDREDCQGSSSSFAGHRGKSTIWPGAGQTPKAAIFGRCLWGRKIAELVGQRGDAHERSTRPPGSTPAQCDWSFTVFGSERGNQVKTPYRAVSTVKQGTIHLPQKEICAFMLLFTRLVDCCFGHSAAQRPCDVRKVRSQLSSLNKAC